MATIAPRTQADIRHERLLAHRELQYLRACAWRPPPGQHGRHQRWISRRAWKLDKALERVV